MTALCLRILQAALVYVNTLMLQDVLAEDTWADMLTTEDVLPAARKRIPDRHSNDLFVSAQADEL